MTSASTAPEFLATAIESTPEGDRVRRCIQCGSCNGICPFGFAMDYPPRTLIAALRANDFATVKESDTIWLCVSCFACTSVCPSRIPLTAGILASLKSQMLLEGDIPQELQTALANSRRYGNALGESPRKRADWAKDFAVDVPVLAKNKEPVDVLWYVGDYGSYHPRVQQITRALAKIFDVLGVKFAVLGPEETCDGDTQRLCGESGLWEMLAHKTAKTLAKYKFKEIVTADAHAYNAFKHEYPRLGFEFPVRHHLQFLFDHLDRLKPLMTHEVHERVTYHDPCYLGRVNDNALYNEPRTLLKAIPGVELVEMPHNRETSICCGGGGGGMWLDGFSWEKAKVRTTDWRVQEAVSVGAAILAIACPYEPPRFEDAVKSTGNEGKLAVKDIAELIAEAIYG